jgi:protein-S-isoprenylcysteine O-methyltransferase Ste14
LGNENTEIKAISPLRVGIRRFVVIVTIFGVLMFGTSGDLGWPNAWAYLALLMFWTSMNSWFLVIKNPDLGKERMTVNNDNARRWDIVLIFMMVLVGPGAVVVIAGLNYRYGWTNPGLIVQISGFIIVFLGYLLSSWALWTNQFFSSVVRIQTDRGHHVIDRGPYAFIRHPGYAGAILSYFGIAFLLGSYHALAGCIFATCITCTRTYLEDRTLKSELEGYLDYSDRVTGRIIPAVW